LVPDPVTSSLDAESETLAQGALEELMRHRSTLAIGWPLSCPAPRIGVGDEWSNRVPAQISSPMTAAPPSGSRSSKTHDATRLTAGPRMHATSALRGNRPAVIDSFNTCWRSS